MHRKGGGVVKIIATLSTGEEIQLYGYTNLDDVLEDMDNNDLYIREDQLINLVTEKIETYAIFKNHIVKIEEVE